MSEIMKLRIIQAVIYQMILCPKIIWGCYCYFGKRELYGETLYKVHGSKMRTAVHLGGLVLVLVLWGYCVRKIFGDSMETVFIDYIYLALLLVEAIVAGIMDVRPQKIYENGILGYKGFIPWSDMRGILDSKRKSVILIKAKANGRINYREEISCRPEEKEALEKYILKKIEEYKASEMLAMELKEL